MKKENKVWKIEDCKGLFTDNELIEMIKAHKITGNTRLSCKEIKEWIKLEDSIYSYYLPQEDKNEVI